MRNFLGLAPAPFNFSTLIGSLFNSMVSVGLFTQILRIPRDRFTSRNILSLIALCAGCAFVTAYLFNEAYWVSQIIVWSAYIVTAKVISCATWRKVLAALATAYVINAVSLCLTALLAGYVFTASISAFSRLSVQWDYQLTFLLLINVHVLLAIVCIAVLRRHTATFTLKTNLTLGAWTVQQAFVVCLYLYYTAGVRNLGPGFNWIFLVLTISYALLTIMYLNVSRRRMRRLAARQAIKAEVRTQQQRFDALSTELVSVRQFRHDLNNHMAILASLVRNDQREEALRYLNSLEENLENASALDINAYMILDALVSAEASFLKNKGITMECQTLSTTDPQSARRVKPPILWASSFAAELFQETEEAHIELTFAENASAVDCMLSPCNQETAEHLLEQRVRSGRVPFEVQLESAGQDWVLIRIVCLPTRKPSKF